MKNKHTGLKRFITNNIAVFSIIAFCFISRLPQLCSPHFIMDGDECIEGLMAKHLYEGKDAALYFYGQNYGLSIIETSMIAGGFSLFGISDYTVKFTMLLLWTIGVVFFYKTLKSLDEKDTYLPIVITLLLIVSPAWAVWSMKARGGYLTAFTLSNVILYLSFSNTTNRKQFTWLCIGILLFLVYKCQPLWLPPLMPLLVYTLWKTHFLKNTGMLLSGVCIVFICFYFLQNKTNNFWQPEVFNLQLVHPQQLAGFIYNAGHGFYYLHFLYEAPLANQVFSISIIVFLVLLPALILYYIFTTARQKALFIVSCFSVFTIIGYLCFINPPVIPRYALPLTIAILFSLFVLLRDIQTQLKYALCMPWIITGIISLVNFKNYSFMPVERKAIVSTVSYLEKQHLNYIFSTQGLLQWQLMFYSEEKLQARFIYSTDRYPLYVQNVNTAYNNDPSKTAIVGFSQDFNNEIEKLFVKDLGSGFSIYPSPSAAALKMREYEF